MSTKTSFKQVRFFSLDLKKYIVKQIESGGFSITQASREYEVSITTIYKWLYKYSINLKKGTRIVVEKDSVEKNVAQLKRQIKELEAALGRKSLQSDLYEIMIDLASKELKTDIKKNFGEQVSTNLGKKL